VTGSSGYIGRSLVSFLLKKGFDVKCFDKAVDSNHDILNVKELEKQLRICDFVYNCAAIPGIDECERDKKEAFKVNVTGADNVVDVAKGFGCKPILIGSFAVDGDSYYGYTKRVMEDRNKDRAVILRCANIYGGRDYKELKPNGFISRIAVDDPIRVFDKTQIRDFTHLSVVLDWCLKAQALDYGVYNVCTGFRVPIETVALIVGTVRDVKVKYGR